MGDRVRMTADDVRKATDIIQSWTADKPQNSPRIELLNDAMAAVVDRNNQYGPPTQDFERSAGILNALGYFGPDGAEILPHDVAIIISAVKLSRLVWSFTKRDSWLDLAGYAACGYECTVTETGLNASSEEGSTETGCGCI